MGWKVKKDGANTKWEITERKVLDSMPHQTLNDIERRRKEISLMSLSTALRLKSTLCLEEKKLWL